jgi:hypothetical protein
VGSHKAARVGDPDKLVLVSRGPGWERPGLCNGRPVKKGVPPSDRWPAAGTGHSRRLARRSAIPSRSKVAKRDAELSSWIPFPLDLETASIVVLGSLPREWEGCGVLSTSDVAESQPECIDYDGNNNSRGSNWGWMVSDIDEHAPKCQTSGTINESKPGKIS